MRVVNEKQVDRFCTVYAKTLSDAVEHFPVEYAYNVSDVPGVIAKMGRAFVAGSYNFNGRAIKAACRAVGITHTRKAMETFFTTAEAE
jgi:hypothetical protein